MKRKLYNIFLLLLVAIIMLSGCGNSGSNSAQQSSSGSTESSKAPKQLTSIETYIEKIFKELGIPSIILNKDTEEDSQDSSGSNDSSSSSNSSQSSNQSQSTGSNSSQSSGSNNNQSTGQKQGEIIKTIKDVKLTDENWKKLYSMAVNLHYKWDSYMPMATKIGASKKLIDDFSNILNNLTDAIGEKISISSMNNASALYFYIPDFYLLYKEKEMPEIKRIIYFTRSTLLYASNDKWDDAIKEMNNLKSSWSLLKGTYSKSLQQQANKLDFSIYELDKVVTKKDLKLVDIKSRIAMSNIEAIEKAIEKQTTGG